MSEAQTLARSLYAKDPGISSADLAAACGRTKRWATGELSKLRGTAVVDTEKISAAEPTKGKSKPSLTIVPTPTPKPTAKPSAASVRPPEAIPEAQPRGARAVVWLGFGAGILASIAANAASAHAGWGSMLAAGFPAIALVLAVEAILRPRWKASKGQAWLRWGGLGLVALVAAVVSYGHQRALLLSFGESELNASILPLAVDGLVTVCATALIAMKGEK